ncbi:dTDP-4-dehydrorhamnose 3,5-epimerase [Paucibacter sediminis]|uniref:dTDP-4-dehydrorhamnose 3,5-epimerase n=1 Tax=Paucibacter sediminis TaxID=3019553 RepID=A0AA95ND83_9BURK|nr:dTDP-4-dehydrorhamnose 3,5-epimerase [Paucibacter sp. S2-9]WIT10064.1 dTDP-4-dehydrorhamnose 3,5-epimerase [Paucibacter sp. S2-9]
MKLVPTRLPGLFEVAPKVYGDTRGFFYESWNQRAFEQAIGTPVNFVQDNHSRSRRGVLRGLHFQRKPHAQGKLVRCIRGNVFDVAVDLRTGSPTYGQWEGRELSEQNQRQFWIPPGFAHGFVVLSESADFLYKTTDYYAPECEGVVRWDDPQLGIAWPNIGEPFTLAEKDAAAPLLAEVGSLD